MKVVIFIGIINPMVIALTTTPIDHWMWGSKAAVYWDPPTCGPVGGAQGMCDTRNINQMVNTA
jgi:hypothetical protein